MKASVSWALQVLVQKAKSSKCLAAQRPCVLDVVRQEVLHRRHHFPISPSWAKLKDR